MSWDKFISKVLNYQTHTSFQILLSLHTMGYMKKLIYVTAKLLAWHKSTCIYNILRVWKGKLIWRVLTSSALMDILKGKKPKSYI